MINRSYWVDAYTWADPDCIECGGEGAPCCEPPDGPSPLAVSGAITTHSKGARIEATSAGVDFYGSDGSRMPDDPTERVAWFRRGCRGA